MSTDQQEQQRRQKNVDELYYTIAQRLEEERLVDLQDQQLLSGEDKKRLEEIQLTKRKEIRVKRSRRSYRIIHM